MRFERFDDLVTSYYADEFEEASKLFHEQRFSRIRELPGVFAEILEGTRRWEPSERRGLGEEVLKEAEAVLMRRKEGRRGEHTGDEIDRREDLLADNA
ncbi:basic-Leucine zipper transcription factor [Fusarium agapanthi]|uniref:Basic-Leucine zipper transcription factor n=1 Tax=Fusarium agapanthi TaxID=1803897 RepID=A0A9P5E975_9HYPO|nr:basic-Leucine zipper transcription factor [Fusarium agapanthi]